MAGAMLAPPFKCMEDAVDQLDRGDHPKGTTLTKDEDFDAFLRRASKTIDAPASSSSSTTDTTGTASTTASAVHEPVLTGENGGSSSSVPIPQPQRYVSPKDFELLKVIGMGSFGKVLQVRNKSTGTIHAMKIISKRLLRRKTGYVDNILVEQAIMARVRHPFVVQMHCSFQTRDKLFLIMDFLAGGELFLRLGREGIFLEKTAAFYLGTFDAKHRCCTPQGLSCAGYQFASTFPPLNRSRDYSRARSLALPRHPPPGPQAGEHTVGF
jgi:Protein kinase domain